MTENAVGYTLDVQAGALPDGTVTEGDYRVLVGVNAPDVLTGQAQPQGDKVLEAPIEVKSGLRILRISAVDSHNENFSVVGSLRMDWTDPDLAFSPDSCNCSVKLYTDKEFDRFLAEVGSQLAGLHLLQSTGKPLDPEPGGGNLARWTRPLCGTLQHHLPGRFRFPAVPL